MDKNKIAVRYGMDMQQMVLDLMRYADIKSELHDGMKIALKPNLVVAKEPSSGATTHTEILEGVLMYLKESGDYDVTIMEGSWVGDSTRRAFRVCGYDTLAEKYGAKLLDLKRILSIYTRGTASATRRCRRIT